MRLVDGCVKYTIASRMTYRRTTDGPLRSPACGAKDGATGFGRLHGQASLLSSMSAAYLD